MMSTITIMSRSEECDFLRRLRDLRMTAFSAVPAAGAQALGLRLQ